MGKVHHVLHSQDFDRALLERLFAEADKFNEGYHKPGGHFAFCDMFPGRLMYSFFYEPSTRTRFSFETAARRLGMSVVSTENASQFSSKVKGESLEDTIRVLCGYGPDVIVLRHKADDSADRAARIADLYGVPIVNAGAGKSQHPTQALLDIYTIANKFGSVDGRHVMIGGDLSNGRTTKSLAHLHAKFAGTSITFVSPPELRIGQDILDHLDEHGVQYSEVTSRDGFLAALPAADVVYWTRPQTERSDDPVVRRAMEQVAANYRIGNSELALMKPGAIIMHPLPRNDEIAKEVDDDLRAYYFKQAENGLYIRMALLSYILSA